MKNFIINKFEEKWFQKIFNWNLYKISELNLFSEVKNILFTIPKLKYKKYRILKIKFIFMI
jgi:hypothetical protein